MKKTLFVTVAALAAFSGSALATEYSWNWTPAQGGFVNNAAGTFQSINASFNAANNTFTWSTTFGGTSTNGYTLAVSPGANPKGHAGELALIYFDFSNGTPRLTAYAYNGANLLNSFQDGNANVSGNQAPDLIHSLNNTSWYSASVVDNGGNRTFNLTVDANVIQNHNPMYPGPLGPNEWTGVEFGANLGLWFHSFTSLSTSYNSGRLTGWNFGQQGWFDGAGFQTVLVPLPTAAWAGIAGLGMVGLVARRRARSMR